MNKTNQFEHLNWDSIQPVKVSFDEQWTQDLLKMAECSILNALKSNSLDDLKQTIKRVGLPPSKTDEAKTLLKKACEWNYVEGFQYLTQLYETHYCSDDKKIEDDDDPDKNYSFWKGFMLNGEKGSLYHQGDEYEEINKRAIYPLAYCFDHDNPLALKSLIDQTLIYKKLKQWEPEPVSEDEFPGHFEYYGRSSALSWERFFVKKEAIMDNSLLITCIRMNAFKCVALLSCYPEFSRVLYEPEKYWIPSKKAIYCNAWDVETPEFLNQNSVNYHGMNTNYQFSAWDFLLNSVISMMDKSYSNKLDLSWFQVILKNAPDSVKQWKQEGSGMGWVEMYIERFNVYDWSSNPNNAVYLKHLENIQLMNELGFKINWDWLRNRQSNCKSHFQEWLKLQSVLHHPSVEDHPSVEEVAKEVAKKVPRL